MISSHLHIFAVVLILLLAGCTSKAQRELERISRERRTPMPSAAPFNDYVRCGILPDGTETGVIDLADGSTAEYWFRSYRLTGDLGGTLFRLSDGSTLFMAGYFCCEVKLPEKQLASLDELRAFVRRHDGVRPPEQ